MMLLPPARTTELIQAETGKELLLYDLRSNKVYSLNETLATVFRACDGGTPLEEVVRRHGYTDELIYLALDELKRNNLLEGEVGTHFPGMTRREAVKKVALSTLVVLPVIASVIAPMAASAQSRTCTAPNPGGAPGGSSTTMSGDVTTLKRSCQSCCYRDYSGSTRTGTCCTNCNEPRCQ